MSNALQQLLYIVTVRRQNPYMAKPEDRDAPEGGSWRQDAGASRGRPW